MMKNTQHALDLDSLYLPLATANQYVDVVTEFFKTLHFNDERIEAIECRRRDGFIPHSYNNGGLQAITYRTQYECCQDTGFENTDKVLEKYSGYNLDYFIEEHPELKDVQYSEWSEEMQGALHNDEAECDDTVQFQVRVMFTSETTANVDFYVSASDTPYHRSSDDKLELEVTFKSPAGLAKKLKALLKDKFVARLATNVRAGF